VYEYDDDVTKKKKMEEEKKKTQVDHLRWCWSSGTMSMCLVVVHTSAEILTLIHKESSNDWSSSYVCMYVCINIDTIIHPQMDMMSPSG